MPNEDAIYRYFNEISSVIIRDAYLDYFNKVAFDPERSWLVKRLKRTTRGVKGLKVHIPFQTRKPITWRGMTEKGYTPAGADIKYDKQVFELACCVAACNATYKEVLGCGMDWSKVKDITQEKVQNLIDTFPYYLRAILWSPQAANKAVGVVASVGGTGNLTITLDNDGLWNTKQEDRCKLIERGMYLQGYDGSTLVKKGDPVVVDDVDKDLGKFTLESSTVTFADGDYFVPSDAGGLDNPQFDCPGVLDVIDDDNTFQGVNRAATGNKWARAYVQDAHLSAFNYTLLSKFFRKCFDPREAIAHIESIQAYVLHHMAANVRYTPAVTYEENYTHLKVDNTVITSDDDVDRDKIIVPDFNAITIREAGPIGPLHSTAAGWKQVEGRPFMEYVVGKWFTLAATDVRKCGLLIIDNTKFA